MPGDLEIDQVRLTIGSQQDVLPLLEVYVGRPAELAQVGSLSDVAPTMLALMGIEKPVEMTGHSLVELAVPDKSAVNAD